MSIPPRTNPQSVQAVLGGTSLGSNWDGMTDLTPFIATASAIVDRAVTGAANKGWVQGGVTLSAVEAELIERWLAAHFYVVMDPLYQSKSTQGASGSFQRKTESGFEVTDYGRTACQLDYSGTLRAIGLRQFAGGQWLGQLLNPNEFTDPADIANNNPNGLST